MEKGILKALKEIMVVCGNLKKPIPPGAVFATLPPEEEFRAVDELADYIYPPIIADGSGCVFDPDERTLSATVLGKVVFSSEGLRIKPCWRMSRDKMLLTVDVYDEDFEGEPITLKRIQSSMPRALEDSGIVMDFRSVGTALEESTKTGKGVAVTLAQGSLPEPGDDAYLELTFKTGQGAGTLREDGSMDFRERSDLHSVAEGELLGTLFLATEGTPGFDLFKNELRPPVSKHLKIIAGQGVKSSSEEEGSIQFTAAQGGVVRFHNGVLAVTGLLEIPGDVDFSTGNIHASQGTIHIKGDVKSGFRVEGAGDVIVDGVVEDADIVAGGLVIAGGVIMSGENTIVAEESVSAHFFRNAIIEAGGDVTADLEMSHCTVKADGKVSVLGEKGIISGGHIISGDDIQASIIGNKACAETCVEIRVPDTAGKQLDEAKDGLEEELKALDRAIGVDFDLSQLLSAPEEDRRILAELIKVRAKIQAEIRTIEEANKSLLLKAQQQVAAKRIMADRKVYCGVEVIICSRSHKVRSDLESPRFFLDAASQKIAWE